MHDCVPTTWTGRENLFYSSWHKIYLIRSWPDTKTLKHSLKLKLLMASLILRADIQLQARGFSVPWHLKRGCVEGKKAGSVCYRTAGIAGVLHVVIQQWREPWLCSLLMGGCPLSGGTQGFTLQILFYVLFLRCPLQVQEEGAAWKC